YTPAAGSSNDLFMFDLWFDTNGNVEAGILTPDSIGIVIPQDSGIGVSTPDGAIILNNFVNGSNNNANVSVTVFDFIDTLPPAPGIWTVAFGNNSGSTITYHGWLSNTTIGTTLNGGDNQYTVAAPGTASEAITVGSYVSRWRWLTSNDATVNYTGTDFSDNISSFSSIGPRRDGAQKPDITAPGQAIVSATSSDITLNPLAVIADGNYHINQGTSMSAPVVTGAAALLLEQSPSLTASQVKNYLTDNAVTDTYTGVAPNTSWGYGRLNIFSSMTDLVNPGWGAMHEVLAYDQWNSSGAETILPILAVAVRFTPSFSGKITGVFVHLAEPFSLTGDVSFSIAADTSGFPAIPIGEVLVPAENLSRNGWSYINFRSANVTVTGGSDYHVVLNISDGSSEILLDEGNPDGRTSISSFFTPTWSSVPEDARIRVINTTSDALLPVELLTFSVSASNKTVNLKWQTATEVNNYGFEIERLKNSKTEGLKDSKIQRLEDWEKIGFVGGAGNSNSLKEYSFIDEKPINGKTLYRLKQIDNDGQFSYSEEVEVYSIPMEYALDQNYPNPFNPATNFGFRISNPGLVTLKLYDVLGGEVATLVNEKKEPGFYEVKFDGSALASGVYYYRLTANNSAGGTAFTSTKKFIVLK
ncbi:MAG: S8 family serine peptidase, partial [Ignavibacteriaceae bacterium]